MVTAEVRVLNGERLHNWLKRAPARIERSLFEATEEGVEIEAAAIRELTPVLTGALLRSISTRVVRSLAGAEGTVESDSDHGDLVERGTRQHGEAHHMFQRGAEATERQVEGRFESRISSLMGSFGNV